MTGKDQERAAACLKAMNLIGRFDASRVEAYRHVPGNESLMGVGVLGDLQLLHNAQVGYFNRVYGFTEEHVSRLPEVVEFYRELERDFFLVVPHDLASESARKCLGDQKFIPYEEAVFLQRVSGPAVPESKTKLQLSPVSGRDVDAYVDLYLECFEARPENIPSAKENMRELIRIMGLEMWLVRKGAKLAGLCAAFSNNNEIFLCAGAVHPDLRGTGIHHEMIRWRVERAVNLKLDRIITWASKGGPSHHNLAESGFDLEFPVTVFSSPLMGRARA